MLHRLFNTGAQRHTTDADVRSHLLLHGNHGDSNPNLGGSEARLVIAQELPDRAKVVLLDTQRSSTEPSPSKRSPPCPGSGESVHSNAAKTSTSTPELVTELMFGTAPLSYRDSSVRVHPLPAADGSDRRSFLFTKIFTVNSLDTIVLDSPSSGTSGPHPLLSSSYGSVSGLPEYPFPTMTPMDDTLSKSTPAPRDYAAREAGTPQVHASRSLVDSQRNRSGTFSMARTTTSAGSRTDRCDTAPHVPFVKAEPAQQVDGHLSCWLPSPGPSFRRRRQSTDSAQGSTPGSVAGYSRFEGPICAIGIIFSVPGHGQEGNECALMNRHWQMLTRATYALQRVVLGEIELAVRLLTAHGTAHHPQARDQTLPKGTPQVYRRGKKCLVDLGHGCLCANPKVIAAITDFKTRLFGAINLPDIVRKPLQYEADVLVDELSYLLDTLDQKESNFLFSALFSYLSKSHTMSRNAGRCFTDAQRNIRLDERLVIVSDNPIIARKLIFCIARLLFRDHNDHLDTTRDFALIWPTTGLLGKSITELLRAKQAKIAKTLAVTHGWDIPTHRRPLSQGPYAVSPSIYHRPPSNNSASSSRTSSWKLSWWASIGSRAPLNGDENSSRNRLSDTTTLQTSWSSADFKDPIDASRPGLPNASKAESPQLWSHNGRDESLSPRPDSEVATEEDFEAEPCDPSIALRQLDVKVDEHGAVEVASLQTSSCSPELGHMNNHRADESRSGFPLTGVLSRFHPDMLLQSIPKAAYIDAQLKSYLAEEDSYVEESATRNDQSWSPTASITIAELGDSCRLRKLTRWTRALSPTDASECENRSPDMALPLCEEQWRDETLTDIDDDLLSRLHSNIRTYRETRNVECVQQMIDSFSVCRVTSGV